MNIIVLRKNSYYKELILVDKRFDACSRFLVSVLKNIYIVKRKLFEKIMKNTYIMLFKISSATNSKYFLS